MNARWVPVAAVVLLMCLVTGDKTADGWAMWGGSAGHNGAE